MKTFTLQYVILLIFFALLISCVPQSKEAYLSDFKTFIAEVKTESTKYTDELWKEADQKYTQFTGKWYEKYKDELTWSEDILVMQYKLQYKLSKVKQESKDILDLFLGNNFQALKDQLKHYAENDMTEDIELLVQQAQALGDTATASLKEVINDLNIDLEALGIRFKRTAD